MIRTRLPSGWLNVHLDRASDVATPPGVLAYLA